jgi:bacteriophage N4 adsorption protein A
VRDLIVAVMLFYYVAAVFAQQTGLTEYQEFKSYPFIEKAYRLQNQGNYQRALIEVEKALKVAPDYPEFKKLQLQLQLSLMEIDDLMTMFLNAVPSQQRLMAKPLLETLLSRSESVSVEQYAVVLNQISKSNKTQAVLQVDARLVGQLRLHDSLDLLNSDDSDEPSILQKRFMLASELGQHQTTVSLYSRLVNPLDEQAISRYIGALAALNRNDEALEVLANNMSLPFVPELINGFIQEQIGAQNYTQADRGFELLRTKGLLTAKLQRQRLQMRLASPELQLDINEILHSDFSCWQQAELLVTRFAEAGQAMAEKLLLNCSVAVDEQQQYVTAALSILTVKQLILVIDKVPHTAQILRKGIVAKLIATEDYLGLLTLASDPEYKELIDLSSLAFAYQQTNDLKSAAQTFWYIFQQTGEVEALNEATFLWSALGDEKKVISVLEQQLSTSNLIISESLIIRYLDALGVDGKIPKSIVQILFGRSTGIDAVAEKLRLQQDCEQSLAYIDHYKLTSHSSQVTQALCLQQIGDKRSIAAWKKVLNDSPNLDNFKATLFAMMNTKQHAEVLDFIVDYPQYYQADVNVRQIKLQALIQEARHQDALREWRQQFERFANQNYAQGMELSLQAKQYDYANTLANQLISSGLQISDSEWTVVAQIKTLVNEQEQALAAWKIVLEQNPQSELAQLNLAYAMIPVSSEQALSAFKQYTGEAKNIDPDVWKQMAFLADTVGKYESVSEYLDNYFTLSQSDYPIITQKSWSLHELYQQSHRRWNFNTTASHGNGAVLGDVFYINNQGEVDENLPNNGLSARLSYRLFEDSKRWQAYSQINANGSNLDPVAQQSVELGLSYRLLEDVNVLASAGAIYFSDGEQRLLPFIRLSGDFLNQDDWRNGWRFENSWWERQWYNDILYFTDNEQIFAISRFDGGYVWPLSTETKQTVKFYGLVQFDYRKQPISTKELKAFDQTSIGMGIQWRLFDTPSSKNQSASVWSASLELRNRVLGDLTNDDVGVFITIGYKY